MVSLRPGVAKGGAAMNRRKAAGMSANAPHRPANERGSLPSPLQKRRGSTALLDPLAIGRRGIPLRACCVLLFWVISAVARAQSPVTDVNATIAGWLANQTNIQTW